MAINLQEVLNMSGACLIANWCCKVNAKCCCWIEFPILLRKPVAACLYCLVRDVHAFSWPLDSELSGVSLDTMKNIMKIITRGINEHYDWNRCSYKFYTSFVWIDSPIFFLFHIIIHTNNHISATQSWYFWSGYGYCNTFLSCSFVRRWFSITFTNNFGRGFQGTQLRIWLTKRI